MITQNYVQSLGCHYVTVGDYEEVYLIEANLLDRLEIPDLQRLTTPYLRAFNVAGRLYIGFDTLRFILANAHCPEHQVENWKNTLDTLRLLEHGF